MLVIAPSHLHEDILNYYRKDNPLFDIKLISKSDLSKAVNYSKKDSSLVILMESHNLSYDIAEMYLKYIPYLNDNYNHKFDEILKIQKELIDKNLLYIDEASKLLYSNKTALVIGYQKDDDELKYLSDTLNLKLEFFEFTRDYKVKNIYEFTRIEDEIYYTLNDIAHLLDLGEDISNIVIVRKEKTYDYYLKKYAPTFGYQINIENSIILYDTGLYSEFIKLYEDNHDINTSLEELKLISKDDDLYDGFVRIVKGLILKDTAYEIQKEYLIHKIKNMKIDLGRYDKAVKVSEEFGFYQNKHVFVLGFMQSIFPKTNKDSDYFSNDELHHIHLLTAKEETRFDQENILNLLSLDNKYYLSYSLNLGIGGYGYPSPIANILGLEKIKDPFPKYFYSKKVLSYIACDLEDSSFYYDNRPEKYHQTSEVVDLDYNSYHNEYSKVDVYKSSDVITLSTSSLDTYSNCPFKYYLERVLEIDKFEGNEASTLGEIVHNILEHSINDNDYDVEKHFYKLIDNSEVDEDTKIIWKLNLVEQVKEAVKAVKKHLQYMKKPEIHQEIKITNKLNENTFVIGRIDKMIVLDNKYLVMVDYKTGASGDFNPQQLEYGLSTQLPTYAYLSEASEYRDYETIGLYINHVLTNSKTIEIKEDELIPSYLKLCGKSIADINIFSNFDNSIGDGKSSFVSGVSTCEEGIKPSSNVASRNEFIDLINKVKEIYMNTSSDIHHNNFPIRPLFIKNFNACSRCSYKDICFVRYDQRYFPQGEKEAVSDE